MSNKSVIPIKEEWDEEVMKILLLSEKLSCHTKQDGQRERTKIQKFPKNMKLLDESLIRPSEISIGPIDANNKHLINRKLKLRLAARFVAESKHTWEFLLNIVKNNLITIKKCFDESVVKRYKDGRLVRILFLDACSVLQFIHSSLRSDLTEFEISNKLANSIQNDLFLLENQLPFQLLKLLINSSAEKLELQENIYWFMAENVISPAINYRQRYTSNLLNRRIFSDEEEEPVHLLDLLRSELLFLCSSVVYNSKIPKIWRNNFGLSLLYRDRNVQELKSAGIKCRPGESSTFHDVSFSKRWFLRGELSLPPIIVNNSTASKLWNLVAYEMCPDNYMCDYMMSSYLNLMASLVDNEQDVRDLMANHILWNMLRTDKEVVRLFKSIRPNLVTDEAYLEVKYDIQKLCDMKSANWAAQMFRDQFSPCFVRQRDHASSHRHLHLVHGLST